MTSAEVNYGVLRTGRVYCSTPCLKSPGVSTDAPDTRSFHLYSLIGVGCVPNSVVTITEILLGLF